MEKVSAVHWIIAGEAFALQKLRKRFTSLWDGSQRRTLTGTVRLKKTVPGSTGKNPRNVAATVATRAIKEVGFFCISK